MSAKKRILFVDDEPMVLQGLQRMLRHMRTDWDMAFVESGSKALDLMAQTPCDVVVSDMRMPGMNGAQLLTEVMSATPKPPASSSRATPTRSRPQVRRLHPPIHHQTVRVGR